MASNSPGLWRAVPARISPTAQGRFSPGGPLKPHAETRDPRFANAQSTTHGGGTGLGGACLVLSFAGVDDKAPQGILSVIMARFSHLVQVHNVGVRTAHTDNARL